MERRSALKLIAIGSVAGRLPAQHAAHSAAGAAEAAGELKFFSAAQNALVDRLTEMIIPADDHSPGAHAASVSRFIDGVLAAGDDKGRTEWAAGLKAVEAEATAKFQKPLLECSAGQQDQIMAAMAENEENPRSEIERFFVELKSRTISGYYTSQIGLLQDLEYKGNVPLAEYPGCDHPEHQA
jgi:hypothetical protein